jgi:integrase
VNRQESAVRLFLRTRRSDATKEGYRRTLRIVLAGRPDAFLRLAQKRPLEAERFLIRFFVRKRKDIASSTLSGYLYCVRSFVTFSGVRLRWERIEQTIPPVRRLGEDRPPTPREIRRFLAKTDYRLGAAALMMLSSGMRVGAFWFPKAGGGYGFLKVRDVDFRDSGVAAVKVYAREAEEYTTFISREAVAVLKRYWRWRRRRGEWMGPHSPVLAVHRGHRLPRSPRRVRRRYARLPSGMAKPLTVDGIQSAFEEGWRSSGVVTRDGHPAFKLCHGFRKRFETEAKRGVGTRLGSWRGVDDRIVTEDVELLLGHHSSYHRPSLARLEAVYLKLQPLLLIRRRAGGPAARERPFEEGGEVLSKLLKEFRRQSSEIAGLGRRIDNLTVLVERLLAPEGPVQATTWGRSAA